MERTIYGRIHSDEATIPAGSQLDYTYTNGTEHWLMVFRFSIIVGPEPKDWSIYLRTRSGVEHLDYSDTADTDIQIGSHGYGVLLGPHEILGVHTIGATSEMHVSLVAYEVN